MIRAADEQDKRMTDDRSYRMPETSSRQVGDPPRGSSSSILDALDMDDVGEIDIVFERPVTHPQPARFD